MALNPSEDRQVTIGMLAELSCHVMNMQYGKEDHCIYLDGRCPWCQAKAKQERREIIGIALVNGTIEEQLADRRAMS